MAIPTVFVDTSGFYALLVRGDLQHNKAAEIVDRARKAGAYMATTDYIVDETATLFKARSLGHLNSGFFELLDGSRALRFQFVDEARFQKSRAYFQRHADHGYSFTDCSSFIVMQEIGAVEALTKDGHFREAGFKVLLSP